MPAENAAQKQRKAPGRPFKKGQSGNPAGKAPGTRNKATRAVQTLLDGEAETLTRKCVDLALEGDTTALRICMERLCPPARERALDADLELPATITAANAGAVFSEVLKAVVGGRLVPGEGKTLVEMMNLYLSAHEYAELSERIDELEQAAPRNKKW